MTPFRSLLRRLGAPLVLAVALQVAGTGCATWSKSNEKPYTHIWLQLEMVVPAEWMAATFSEGLFLTRHGIELDSMHLRRWKLTTEVKGTGRTLEGDLMPHEIAEISLDSRRLDDGVGGLEVLGNGPAVVDGRACYEIDYQFRGETGLPIRTVEVGCAVGPWIYRFEYRAAEQHYFEAGRPDFEALVETIRFKV